MMNEKNLPTSYWVEVANTTVYLMNWCTTSGVRDVTPHEKFYGKKSDLSHVRIFGSIASIHIPNEKRQNLDPKSEKCILVGYSLEQKGYKCFNPSIRKVRVSRDVVFNKSTSWYTIDSAPSEPIEIDLNIDSDEDDRLRLKLEERPMSTSLSGTQEPLSDQSTLWPSPKLDKGMAKMLEFEDADGIKSVHSLNSEYGELDVPIMSTPRVKKASMMAREQLRCST